ncbi:MAG TPA: hypothetical protein VGM39_26075 [Kofleriaceae bacterium]|jgi:hypothetical protein
MRRALVILALVAACHGKSDDAAPVAIEAPKDAITKTVDHGPVKATLKVWPAKPSLVDAIYLRLEVEAPDGVSIDAPFQEAGDQRLGRFKIVGFARDSQRPPTGGQVQIQTYTLEAPSSGHQRIPPLRLEMTDARASTTDPAAKKPQEILTEEVPLEIQPVPAEKSTAQLQPALGELDADVGGVSAVTIIGIAGGALVLIAGSILLFQSRRARRRVEAQRSAYEDAVAYLRQLEERGAPDTTSADSWFVELSSIVRRYLEGRYAINAPDLTTEEFLLVATARPELTTEHRALLSAFMERCDRVKFAGYRPDAEESIATLAAARGFVEDTRMKELAA